MKTKSMHVKDNVLYMGEKNLVELAREYGTPLYVYDEIGINDKIEKFKNNFRSDKFECEIVYASKAFVAPYLCKILAKNGFSIDSVSEGDLYLIKKSGFPMNKVIAHGNNKLTNELTMALDYGIEYLVVDNSTELLKLEYLASRKQKKLKTLVRINPGISAHTHAYIETSQLSSKFGESIYATDILEQMVEVYRNSKYLSLEGFHVHIGSQINNPDSFLLAVKTMCQFMRDFSLKTGLKFRTLDIGGGFAIKYLDDDVEIDLPKTLQAIVKAVEDENEKSPVKIEKLMIEPGRSLVGDSGVTLYTCGSKKTTFSGKKYIFIDGGMADNIRPALYQAKYAVDIVSRMVSPTKEKYDVVGKCCESGDIIATDTMVGEVNKGDVMVVYSTGAYCYSMSMNYNSLMRGAVVFVNGDKVTTAIRRQSFEHMFETCVYEEKDMKIFDIHSDMLYDLNKQSLAGN
ncbi:MAG TPA: diaminopimelate decarboxylase, partial [Bacilli bacterium]|nr:diaminopimelate decarboxylase [Bacilli bacterium]